MGEKCKKSFANVKNGASIHFVSPKNNGLFDFFHNFVNTNESESNVNISTIKDMTTSALLLIGGLGTPELIIILIVVLVLFGGKKIPELMRGLGVGVKNFKDGVNGIEEEINKEGNNTPKDTTTTDGK